MAVLAVLLDHVLETLGAFRGFDPTPFAWYAGRIGVLLFFVLTSLVLLQSLERSARSGPRIPSTSSSWDPGLLEAWLRANSRKPASTSS